MTWKSLLSIWSINIIIGTTFFSPICHAFYEGDNLELQGYISLAGGIANYPANAFYFPNRNQEMWQGDFRILGNYKPSSAINLEGNILESIQSVFENGIASQLPLPLEVERSSIFTWRQNNSGETLAHMSVDVLTFHKSSNGFDVKIGRQPVNFAATFYFVPNDFFAPFAAQTFFRAYKPGVDAIRFDLRPTNLSLVSLLGVLGYPQDSTTDNGWRNRPTADRSSLLIHATNVIHDSEWSLLVGTVRDHTLFGGSFQGEVARWLGVRAEGHYALPEEASGSRYLKLSIGLEHRFINSFDLRVEQFYNGSGYRSTEEINTAIVLGELKGGYLGTHYTALGFGYEFSPLCVGQMVTVINWTDYSQLLSMYLNYSLGDESELAVNITLPGGDEPEGINLGSEFGVAPLAASITFRHFF